MKRRAYTIIELVIAVTILAGTAALAANISVITARTQRTSQISGEMQSQMQAVLAFIDRDIMAVPAPSGPTPVVLRTYQMTTASEGQLLYLTRQEVGDEGVPTGALQTYLYCTSILDATTGNRQLVRMRISGVTPTVLPAVPIVGNLTCTTASVASIFSVPIAQVVQRALTPSEYTVEPLTITPIWGEAIPANYNLNPPSILMPITLSYRAAVATDPRANQYASVIPVITRERLYTRASNRFTYGQP